MARADMLPHGGDFTGAEGDGSQALIGADISRRVALAVCSNADKKTEVVVDEMWSSCHEAMLRWHEEHSQRTQEMREKLRTCAETYDLMQTEQAALRTGLRSALQHFQGLQRSAAQQANQSELHSNVDMLRRGEAASPHLARQRPAPGLTVPHQQQHQVGHLPSTRVGSSGGGLLETVAELGEEAAAEAEAEAEDEADAGTVAVTAEEAASGDCLADSMSADETFVTTPPRGGARSVAAGYVDEITRNSSAVTPPPPNADSPTATLDITPAPLSPPGRGGGGPPSGAKDSPKANWTCQSLTLRRVDEAVPLGLEVRLDVFKRCLIVGGVQPGSVVDAWNRQCVDGDQREILVGDRIVRVNNADDPEAMRGECCQKLLLKLVIAREGGGATLPTPFATEGAGEVF